MNILVDPILIALPLVEDGKEAFYEYVESILMWGDEITLDAPAHTFIIASRCLEALDKAGRYPEYDGVQGLITSLEAKEFSYKTIIRILNRVIRNLPYFEQRFWTEPLCYDETIATNPDLIGRLDRVRPSSTSVGDALRETLGRAAYAKEIAHNPEMESLLFLTYPLADAATVQIDATYLTKQGDKQLTTELPLVSSPEDLHRFVDIWQELGVDEPKSLGEVVEIARHRLAGPHAVFLPSAITTANRAPFNERRRFVEAYRIIEGICVVAKRYQDNDLGGKSVKMAFEDAGFDFAAEVSPTALGQHRSRYTFTYKKNGKDIRVTAGPHLKMGDGNARDSLRLYWYIDEQERCFVICHIGEHLPDSST